jgi:P4 family phage/plasmid primase-like protien
LDCLKSKRADDYDDWRKIGISLFNMDHRNYELWRNWSSQSQKYDEQVCLRTWYKEFPKASKYNLGLNKIREVAKQDNPDKYKQIININKKHFFLRWLKAHMDEKDIHSKTLSISTITKFIYSYIRDYASFNIACALPGATGSVYYKFDKNKWSEDKGANKIYNLLSDTIKLELNDIFQELKDKLLANQRIEHEQARNRHNTNYNEDDDESIASYQRFIIDDREIVKNPEQMAIEAKDNIYTKLQYEKCAAILQFMDTPRNKKTIIEDLSQKSYDEEFYKKLDENTNIFVCNNCVLDLDLCVFRDGQPSDMMTVSSNIDYPKNIDSPEAQEIMFAIQDWLDKIFPDEELQEYTLNEFACKLSGKLYGEKFIICTGSGANGKSQLFKLVKEVFGDYYLQADNTLLNTPKRDANSASPALAILKCKRIVVMTEPKNNLPFESDKVKELVSGDPFVCRHLNKDPIMVMPQYRIFLQCNDIPRNETTDDGFWRKIFVIIMEAKFITKEDDMYKLDDPVKFPNHFKGLDQSHLYKEWAPYFLYLLFERFKVLKTYDFKFPIPNKVKLATKIYQEEASTYTQFFNEKIEEAPGYKIDAGTLYSEFQAFVGRDFKTHKPTFLKQMERFIGKPRGGTNKKEYHGFKIYGTTGETIEDHNANNNNDD